MIKNFLVGKRLNTQRNSESIIPNDNNSFQEINKNT